MQLKSILIVVGNTIIKNILKTCNHICLWHVTTVRMNYVEILKHEI